MQKETILTRIRLPAEIACHMCNMSLVSYFLLLTTIFCFRSDSIKLGPEVYWLISKLAFEISFYPQIKWTSQTFVIIVSQNYCVKMTFLYWIWSYWKHSPWWPSPNSMKYFRLFGRGESSICAENWIVFSASKLTGLFDVSITDVTGNWVLIWMVSSTEDRLL